MQNFGHSIKEVNNDVKFHPTSISRVAVTKYIQLNIYVLFGFYLQGTRRGLEELWQSGVTSPGFRASGSHKQ
jgi:hypothetical protein